MVRDYIYLFAVIGIMVLIPFFCFIFWWLKHETIKEWLWHVDDVTTKWFYWLLDKALGKHEEVGQ